MKLDMEKGGSVGGCLFVRSLNLVWIKIVAGGICDVLINYF